MTEHQAAPSWAPTPGYPEFLREWNAGRNQLLRLTASGDLDTPVSLAQKLSDGRRTSFLLESVTGGENRGRYSIFGAEPDLAWRCLDGRAETAPGNGAWTAEDLPPIESLRRLLNTSRMRLPEDSPPMAAGFFGYLGYDMIRFVERLGPVNPDPLGLPDALLIRPRLVVVMDSVRGQITLGAPVWHGREDDPRQAYDRAEALLLDALARLDRPALGPRAVPKRPVGLPEPRSNTTRPEYRRIVERAREHIRAGDIFQVVPSQRWALPFSLPPFALYRSLRRTNPSPYMFYFDFADYQIVGASPEILVRVRDRRITLRPIAGTRPRGSDVEEDRRLEEELLADSKERAEHLMLLDLGRNDVGRVAEIGSVEPTEQFVVERYSHVMHIASNVEGTLREDCDALDALLAGLPAGTVSGAPKIRAMEIIDDLESVKRGVYAGGIGYFSVNGDMDTCIALRTAVLKDGTMHVQAGGGVVMDSDPDSEYDETVAKASALLRAAAEAGDFAPAQSTGDEQP